MSFLSVKNKWLTLRHGVVLTDTVDPVIHYLDKFFAEAKLRARVTRALVKPQQQLDTIRRYLMATNLHTQFADAMTCQLNDTVFDSKLQKSVYAWQWAWSMLLTRGIIINPPLDAVCLTDYHGPRGGGVNRKGTVIRQTPHVRGTAFDIGGATGDDATIGDELAVVKKAWLHDDKHAAWINYLPEHKNNAIHCDCR